MIDRYLYLTPAVNLFLNRPNPAGLRHTDGLNLDATLILDDIREVLSFFHSVQETLACEKTPTLPFVLPLYEELVGVLKNLCILYPNLMHAIYASIQKLEKYLEEYRYLYVLAMGMSSFLLLYKTNSLQFFIQASSLSGYKTNGVQRQSRRPRM
jgi:hypothetical protein